MISDGSAQRIDSIERVRSRKTFPLAYRPLTSNALPFHAPHITTPSNSCSTFILEPQRPERLLNRSLAHSRAALHAEETLNLTSRRVLWPFEMSLFSTSNGVCTLTINKQYHFEAACQTVSQLKHELDSIQSAFAARKIAKKTHQIRMKRNQNQNE